MTTDWLSVFEKTTQIRSKKAFKSFIHLSHASLDYIYNKYIIGIFSKSDFLMSLHFLVQYPTGLTGCTIWKCGEEKYRSIIWKLIDFLYENIEEVSILDRFIPDYVIIISFIKKIYNKLFRILMIFYNLFL